MNALFWLSFFFASPPASSTCSTNGTPLLEIRERSEVDSTRTLTAKIYNSGAWTVDSGASTDSGCFSKRELRAIRRAVQRARWQVTSSPVACFAYSPEFTEYLLRGRLRYTHRMCSGKTADDGTLNAIDFVREQLADEGAVLQLPPAPPPVDAMPPAPPPPAKPPVLACRASGTPLFEIRHRSDIDAATSTTTIYSNGAWTHQPIDADGQLGAASMGCFDKPTLLAIRHAVQSAPWDVTHSKYVCRAYSPSFTEYHVHGKHEYTARLCGAQHIDETSAASIKRIEAELAKLLPARDERSL